MAHFPPRLVWLASYPKSGNTWVRVLLANLRLDRAEPANINDLPEDESLLSRWRFVDDMLVDPDLLDWRELENLRSAQCDFAATHLTRPFFCKTHDRFIGRSGRPVLGTQAHGAIYILRDPRDVAISFSHHAGLSIDQAIAEIIDPTLIPGGHKQVPYHLGDWGGHVSEWTQQTLLPKMVVRYEDLREDTASTLRGIVSFLGGQVAEPDIQRAVRYSSLDVLQSQETAKGFRESRPGQKRFFRSGRVGEWRDVLTTSQVRTIEERFAPVMARWGYHPES